jgi:hypothetical protein
MVTYGEAESDSPKEDHDDGGELRRGDTRAGCRRRESRSESSDDPHEHGHDTTPPDQHSSTSEAVGEDSHGNECSEESDDAVHTSRKQLSDQPGKSRNAYKLTLEEADDSPKLWKIRGE